MGSNNITSEELQAILDEKLAPLKSDMLELRERMRETTLFLEEVNTKFIYLFTYSFIYLFIYLLCGVNCVCVCVYACVCVIVHVPPT